jgi:hypothetical protein
MANHSPEQGTTEAGLQLEKLRLEVEALRHEHAWDRRLGRWLPLISTLVPVVALVLTVQQFTAQQRDATEARRRQTDADSVASERAFMEPVLTRMMDTYFEASGAAATVASARDAATRQRAVDAFWRLYQGPLVMLESPEVTRRMVAFGDCLKRGAACADTLPRLSRALASSLQQDLFSSWRLRPAEYAQRSIDYARLQDSTAAAAASR